jgi:hypothetical protein
MSDREIARLQHIIFGQETKIRELEEALAKCSVIGIKLRNVLTYLRDEDPSAEQVHTMTTDTLEEEPE